MANFQSIKNWHIGNLLSLLTQNPGVQFFTMTVVEYPFATYPQGVPRQALVDEFNSKADIANQQNGNLGLLRQVYNVASQPPTIDNRPITLQSQVK
jgi:hypothetical protein